MFPVRVPALRERPEDILLLAKYFVERYAAKQGKLRGIGLVKEFAGRNRRRSDGMSFSEAMTARVQLARDLVGVFEREKRPFLALGGIVALLAGPAIVHWYLHLQGIA